ncbi:MAG TPA: D-alanine--D-alanine ligase, partial [Acetobacteraceae bacterium]|nr:D-alanine--D-alanine ligase [Acetobacteraceae bacterium]
YGPVIAQWVALGLWHRDFSLPTAANPRISTGGLCGERKSAVLDLAGEAARPWIAPHTTIVTGVDDMPRAEARLREAGIAIPVVVKPDIGCNGTGVRLARTPDDLAAALASFPRGVTLVLQAFVDLPGEAGLFYIRHPSEKTGRLTSLTLKHPPTVTGNGTATLRALIDADPRHHRLAHLYRTRLAARMAEVPAPGEVVQLVFTGNHCKGSIFIDGTEEITAAMTARIDAIARDLPDFHFGRFDVRYASLASLRRGEEFAIIEINGVGSEATHIWDPRTSLLKIWGDQLHHYGAAWSIGAALRARGARPSGLRAMTRDWINQRRLMASYPLND